MGSWRPIAAGDIFTEDATYQEKPFDEPMRGREAITEYWSGNVKEQDNVQFGYEVSRWISFQTEADPVPR